MSGKPAARVTDPTACPIPGHGNNPIVQGSSNVVFDGLPAARQGDPSACGSPIASAVSSTVSINGQLAATLGSVGAHGNVITAGSGTVIIGDSHSPAPFNAPSLLRLAKSFAQSFAITDSHTGQPLANRPYVALVDGSRRTGVTNADGIANIEAPSADSVIEIHVMFQAPARELPEFSEASA